MVQPTKFRVLAEVFDQVEISGLVLITHDPTHMRPPEAALQGRMHIFFLIGIPVMMAMKSRPPKWSLLQSGAADPCQEELEGTTGAVRAMREISMISGGDTEHADGIQSGAQRNRFPGNFDPESSEASGVHPKKGQVHNPVDAIADR